MASTEHESVTKAVGNLKVLGLAGAVLFFLGLAAFFVAYFGSGVDESRIKMVLSTAFLVALGYPALLYVRLGKVILELERRIHALEERSRQ